MTKNTVAETAALKALLSETADHQILSGWLGFVADPPMALDVDQLCGAGAHERSDARVNRRKIIRETEATSEPEVMARWLGDLDGCIAEIGLEAGLTPLRNQSGERDVSGGITKAGDVNLRRALCQAATVVMNRGRSTWLRTCGAQRAQCRGRKFAMGAELQTHTCRVSCHKGSPPTARTA